jgi:hypothetical protein
MEACAFSDPLTAMNPPASARQSNGAGRNPSMAFVNLRNIEITPIPHYKIHVAEASYTHAVSITMLNDARDR